MKFIKNRIYRFHEHPTNLKGVGVCADIKIIGNIEHACIAIVCSRKGNYNEDIFAIPACSSCKLDFLNSQNTIECFASYIENDREELSHNHLKKIDIIRVSKHSRLGKLFQNKIKDISVDSDKTTTCSMCIEYKELLAKMWKEKQIIL